MALLNNSIGWANFQISGGPLRAAWVCAGVAVVLPLLIFGSTRVEPEAAGRALRAWYNILCVLQGGLLLVALPGRVHGAIRRDRTTKLIESHRLMPTPAAHAIVGYLLGPNLLLMGVIATVFAVGLFLSTLAGQDWRGWIALHVASAGLSFTCCCLVAFTSQWLPKLNPAILILFFGPLFGAISASIVPAIRVMFAPFFTSLPQLQSGEVDPMVVVSAVSQLVFAAILFVGACRRYRRDDVPALGFGWGYVLLSLWVALTLVGTLVVPQDNGIFFDRPGQRAISFVISATLSMLLAVGPVASAATARLRWRERKEIDPYFDEPRPVPVWAATLMVLALLAVLLLAAPTRVGVTWSDPGVPTRRAHLLLSAGIVATFVVTVGLLAWAAGRVRVPVLAIVAFWLLVTWVIPPLVDGARVVITGGKEVVFPGPVGAASPPFGLGAIWHGDLDAARAGLIAQAALIPLGLVAWQLVKRNNRRATPPPVPVAIANGA